jgi:hypothetical protein
MQRSDFDKMPWGERVGLLIASVIAADTKPIATSLALIKLTMVLSASFGPVNRARLVAGLRAAADDFEGSNASDTHDEQRSVH